MQIKPSSLILLLSLVSCAPIGSATQQNDNLEEVKGFPMPQKVLWAFEILNSGKISKWGGIESFDREFKTKFIKSCLDATPGKIQWNTVDLQAQKKSERDDESIEIVGWYVAVACDSKGVITDYYLSNAH